MLAQLIEELEEEISITSIIEGLTEAGADRIERRIFLASRKDYIIRTVKKMEGDSKSIEAFYKQLIQVHRMDNGISSKPINIWK